MTEDAMRPLVRRFALVLFIGAIALTAGWTTGVKADAFTDVGCPTGNYMCLYGSHSAGPAGMSPSSPPYTARPGSPFAAVGCIDGDFNCYYTKVYGFGTGIATSVQYPYSMYYPNDNDPARTQPVSADPHHDTAKTGQSTDDDR